MKMVKVKAITAVRDNGKNYSPGTEFEMEQSLVKPHEAAGQVEAVDKSSATPKDKQVTGSANK